MKQFLFTLSLVSLSLLTFSQSGIIKGKIIDAQVGEELIGATVVITGTTKGTITDFDGNYNISNLEPGTYSLSVSFVSYETQQFTEIQVGAGEVVTIDVALSEETTELDEVVVTARNRQRNEVALQVMQKKSATVMDGISSEQISKLGDSDAAGAVKRVTGVNVTGGKYVFVRGLSDRYSKITLNSADIPGLDPNKNTVQMDLFPSNVIENIIVKKTFSPDLPGNFVGGHVDIITKDFPEKFTVQFSASAKYNSQASLNSDFLSYNGGGTDWLGIDDGTRDIPSIAKNNELPNEPFVPESKVLLSEAAREFNKEMDPIKKKSYLQQSYTFGVGNNISLFGKSLGFNLALSYKTSHDYYKDADRTRYRGIVGDQLLISKDVFDTRGQEEVIWSAFGTLTYKLSNNNKIGIKVLKNQSGISDARFSDGVEPDESRDIQERILGYLERGFTSYQANGKHVLPYFNNSYITWLYSYTNSTQYEPDLRFFYNDVNQYNNSDSVYYTVRLNKGSTRFYRDMSETNQVAKLDYTQPFDLFRRPTKLKFGGAFVTKDRKSNEKRYKTEQQGSIVFTEGPAEFLADENIIHPTEATWPFYYYVSTDLDNAINSYSAEETVTAGYALFDISITDKLRAVLGMRYEYSDMSVANKVDTTAEEVSTAIKEKFASGAYSESDFLPAINLTYEIIPNMNIRLAYSKTIARPVFRELAPYAAWDFKDGIRKVGNPDLKRDKIDNYDIRWEWFFKPGEIIAISGFYKDFLQPIEEYDKEEAKNPEINIRNNTNGAILYGVEFEFRKRLDFISPLEDFLLGTNITFIKSEINEDSLRYVNAITIDPDFPEKREMFGQSPYIVNAYLMYNNIDLGLNANLVFNVAGKKIHLLSKGAVPNVYEQPFPTLDFNISKTFAKKSPSNSESTTCLIQNSKETLISKETILFMTGIIWIVNFQ